MIFIASFLDMKKWNLTFSKLDRRPASFQTQIWDIRLVLDRLSPVD